MQTKNFLIVFLFLVLSVKSWSQGGNCEFGKTAQKHFDNAQILLKNAETETDYLNVAHEYELVLKENPFCENLYLALAEIYTTVGSLAEQYHKDYFSKARFYIRSIRSLTNDDDLISETEKVLSQIDNAENSILKEQKEEQKIIGRQRQIALEQAAERKRWKDAAKQEEKAAWKRGYYDDYSSFFTIGPGVGPSYGEMGVRAVMFPSSQGMVLTGSVGFPLDFYFKGKSTRLRWTAGGGFSFGSYRRNFQLLMQYYGNMETYEDQYEGALGLTGAMNFDIPYSNIGLNINLGYYITTKSDNIKPIEGSFADFIANILGTPGLAIPGLDFSIGLYYKF